MVKIRNKDAFKKRIMKKKWSSLRKRGLKPAKTSEENRVRAKEAHGY